MPTDTAPSSDISVYDVVLIGAGHNVLVAAARLAKAGRRVLVLERNDRVGGCIQSGEVTIPGAVHDLWSTNQNLFVGSPAYAELKADLDRHGVRFVVSERPFASVFPSGAALRVYRDAARTRDGLRRHDARDADGWQRLSSVYDDMEAGLLPLMAMPLPSLAAAGALSKAFARLGPTRLMTAVQAVLSTPRELGLRYVHSPEMRALLAPWAMHLDFGPDVSGGAMFPLAEAFGNQKNGMSVVRGRRAAARRGARGHRHRARRRGADGRRGDADPDRWRGGHRRRNGVGRAHRGRGGRRGRHAPAALRDASSATTPSTPTCAPAPTASATARRR